MSCRSVGFMLVLALFATDAIARVVYKCTTAQGGVAYQDQPCAAADAEALLHVSDETAAAATSAPVDVAPVETAPPNPPADPPRSRTALPPLWLCRNAEDGAVYGTLYGPPPPRSVPLGVLGFPRKSLAQAFAAGSNVMSAPELNKPPVDSSPLASVASNYVQLQDECVVANPDQTCNWLRHQFDVSNEKLGHARFKDERATLQSQTDKLEQALGGC